MRSRDPLVQAKRPRDPRIDAFRGLALIMIFVDHVPGNPYERFTMRNFGFSDAAESFFVMSGIAAGLAYSGRFLPGAVARDGLWAAVRPVWGRAWTLYLSHLFLTAWAIAIFAWGAATFDLPKLLTTINLRQVFENTEAALIGLPALTHQLGYVNILPAYSVLLLCTPVAIVIGLRSPLVLALLAAGLWFAAGLWRLNLPNYPNPGGWFFNPVAWQAIFVTGLLIGLRLRAGARLLPVSRPLFWLAAGYLVLVIAWMKVEPLGHWLNQQLWHLGKAGAPFHLIAHDKTFLSLPRLLHVLAMVYVISCLPAVTRMAASAAAAPLRLMGRNGLLTFATGTLVALVFQVAFAAWPDTVWLRWGLPPLGIAAMLAAATLAEAARRGPRRVQGREGTAPHAVPAE
ncbi:OpgC family protein [Rhodovulum euryhalinum]|uniref:OpgC protein n=1 Tax=Rhodovulum euryhalinum TaxID=35805 RepID=A0A4R2KX06_9RHOB|nr:OpgC domain-containing protein [Rhodovulum euryhalinum]TCO71225.1 hypothetical protein EV655_107118 [Rhodovulum euryhalinum]